MSGSLLTSNGFPPEREIFAVSDHSLRVSEGPHPWFVENEAEIARNWNLEIAANPNLFNGEMVFQRALSIKDGFVAGRAHIVPYATYLHWRRSGRGAGAHHLFAMPLIISADGALIAIRMADTTANPGRVYPPAGSLDNHDVVAGLCDLDGNMRRETMEETGLDLIETHAERGYRAFHLLNTVAMFRIFRSDASEHDLIEHIMAHVAQDPDPEISGALGIRSSDPGLHNYSPFMPPVLNWLFDERNI